MWVLKWPLLVQELLNKAPASASKESAALSSTPDSHPTHGGTSSFPSHNPAYGALSHIPKESTGSLQRTTYPSGSHWGIEESPSSEIFKKRRKKLAHGKWKSAYGLGSEQSRSYEPFCDRTNLKSKPIPYYHGHQIDCCREQYLLHSKQKDLRAEIHWEKLAAGTLTFFI